MPDSEQTLSIERRRAEEGQDLAEYGLLVALIAIVVLVGVTLLGGNLLTFFLNIAAGVPW